MKPSSVIVRPTPIYQLFLACAPTLGTVYETYVVGSGW